MNILPRNPEPGTRNLRLFVAVELPEAWRAWLAREAGALDAATPGFGRWVEPSLMHITLVFLGGQPAEMLAAIERAVEGAAEAGRPFKLRPGRLGSFGGPRSVRVIWAGAEEAPRGTLTALHGELTRRLDAERVPFEPTPLRPHITLGRARRDATSAQSEVIYRALRARNDVPAAHASVQWAECSEIVLTRSDLHPTGPIYTSVLRAGLGLGQTSLH